MNDKELASKEICVFIIWPHSGTLQSAIRREIESAFEIVRISCLPSSQLSRVIRCSYSFNILELYHLYRKTYNIRKSIFNDEIVILVGYTHASNHRLVSSSIREPYVENSKVKGVKTRIREMYNSRYISGGLVHDHVIHASDNESQALAIIEVADPAFALELATSRLHEEPLVDLCNISRTSEICRNRLFRKIRLENSDLLKLRCNILTGDRHDYRTVERSVLDTPHYNYLTGDHNAYVEYIDTYLGTGLKAIYSDDRYNRLIESTLRSGNQSPIIIKEKDGYFLVIDGLHRASIAVHQGKSLTAIITDQ